jgi:hypothetical protein
MHGAERRVARRGLLWALVAAPLAGRTSAAATAWRSDFSDRLAAWGPLRSAWGQDNHEYRRDPGVAGQALRVHLRRGSIDPGSMTRRGLPRSGTGFKAALLAGGSTEATLGYRVRFAPGFDFVRGGKLPGLFGGLGPSGGQVADAASGFSTRFMWRERGAGEVYAYLPGGGGRATSLMRGQWAFEPGRWHRLTQHLRLNAPGQSDGFIRIGLDGRWLDTVEGLRVRDAASVRIDGVFFDLFFGGNDDSWAARADTFVDFAEFELQSPMDPGRGPGSMQGAPR